MQDLFQLGKEAAFLEISDWKNVDNQLIAGFTTRRDGVSNEPFQSLNLGLHVDDKDTDVIQNRKILGQKLLIDPSSWVCGEQVHGNQVKKITHGDKGKGSYDMASAIPSVDGFYTDQQNILLTAGFADCVPLFFYIPRHHIVGIAHAGWKGSVLNIGQEMVKQFVNDEKIGVQDIFSVIGPSIGECCYKVDQRVIEEVDRVLTGIKLDTMPYKRVSDSQYVLNLKELNKQLLIASGVPNQNVGVSSYCTSCHPDLFFSHRRDQGKTGRMLGFIGIVNK